MAQAWHSLWQWVLWVLPALSNLVLILLGIIMSLPTLADSVEKTPSRKRLVGGCCLIFGMIGFFFDVSQRRSQDIDTRNLIYNMTDLVNNTNGMVIAISPLQSQMASLKRQMSDIDDKILVAQKQRDDALVLKLESQKKVLQKQFELVDDNALFIVVPTVIRQLRHAAENWNQLFAAQRSAHATLRINVTQTREVAGLMRAANSIREQLLNRLPAAEHSPDDQIAADKFNKFITPSPWFEESNLSTFEWCVSYLSICLNAQGSTR